MKSAGFRNLKVPGAVGSERSEAATRSLRVSKSHRILWYPHSNFLEHEDMLKVYYSDRIEVTNFDRSSCLGELWCSAWGICKEVGELELTTMQKE